LPPSLPVTDAPALPPDPELPALPPLLDVLLVSPPAPLPTPTPVEVVTLVTDELLPVPAVALEPPPPLPGGIGWLPAPPFASEQPVMSKTPAARTK
jgi:hypothetical protein